jgi:hypothetical protein
MTIRRCRTSPAAIAASSPRAGAWIETGRLGVACRRNAWKTLMMSMGKSLAATVLPPTKLATISVA